MATFNTTYTPSGYPFGTTITLPYGVTGFTVAAWGGGGGGGARWSIWAGAGGGGGGGYE